MTLPPPLPRWAWYAIGAALLVFAFVAERHSFGKRQFNAGEASADAKWEAASKRLVAKAHKSAAKADTAAAARAADYAAKVEDEKEAIDAAIQNGTSPLDALFGADR